MQGDYLPNCLVPMLPSDFGPRSQATDLAIHTVDLVVITPRQTSTSTTWAYMHAPVITPHPLAARVLLVLWALAWAGPLPAETALARPFTDHMVLQCTMPVPVWGTAAAGEVVTVEFAGQVQKSVADDAGAWSVTLTPLTASAVPQVLTVRGGTTLTRSDVLVGEVWFCSGQSNMQASLDRLRTIAYPTADAKQQAMALIDRELATTTPEIRLFQTAAAKKAAWAACGPPQLGKQEDGDQGFSAVAYFFGRHLHQELKVPIGLVQATVGGSRIELWTPPQAYVRSAAFTSEGASVPVIIDGVEPGKFFRTLVQPWARFGVRGVLWYQGESNVLAGDHGPRYADKMQVLIEGWRQAWAQPSLPFYYVQLPPMAYSRRKNPSRFTPQSLPSLREGQALALRVADTGMIVTTDLAPVNDIHPADKWNVGLRLGNLALARSYGKDGIPWRGPLYQSMEAQGATLVLSFASGCGVLISRDGRPLIGFQIAGADRVFVPADAIIAANRITVSSSRVAQPVAVRFAWHEESRPNLCNSAGLPAEPFRSDDWPIARAAPAPVQQ